MKTSRTDVKRDKRAVKLNYDTCSMLGYSRLTLEKGDCFIYRERHTDGTEGRRLAKSHGRIKPNGSKKYYILAQATNDMMSFTYERWVEPKDVLETYPKEQVKEGIKTFFEDQIKLNGY